MTDFLDIALVYDPVLRRTDLALGADGDLALDETPGTPMLISIGTDRRARPDDAVVEDASFVAKRGWAGDAVDAGGRLIGSRLWLLGRAKHNELTRRFAEEWAREALAWAETETGRAAQVTAAWLRAGVLSLTCLVDERSLAINRRVG